MTSKRPSSSFRNDSSHSRKKPQPPAVQTATSPLLQLPAAVFHAACLFLPFWDRLLHLSHVHRLLPPAWLEWAEHDHVRLSEALLTALEQQQPSAVQCARCVQSLCVEYMVNDWLRAEYVESRPCPQSRLHSLLSTLQQAAQSPSAAPPFGQLRSLLALPFVLRRLLTANDSLLQHLHSYTAYASRDVGANSNDSPSLSACWPMLPSLRRVRGEGVDVSFNELLALPCIEHIDARRTTVLDAGRGQDTPSHTAAPPSSLRTVLATHTHPSTSSLLTSLSFTSLQHLSITARPDMDALRSFTMLQSLSVQGDCRLVPSSLLSCLVSAQAEPLLPSLRRLSLLLWAEEQGSAEDNRGTYGALSTLLHAYSRLQHLVLCNLERVPDEPLQALLPQIFSKMPLLESLAVELGNCRDGPPVLRLSAADVHRPLSLCALRALTLMKVPIADAHLVRLLRSCPQLIALRLDWVTSLPPEVWHAVLQCRQLQSIRWQGQWSREPMDPAMCVPASSVSPPAPVTLPTLSHLSHLGLSWLNDCLSPTRFAGLLGTLHGSRITSLALHIPGTVDRVRLIQPLAALPLLTHIRLGLHTMSASGTRRRRSDVLQLLEQCTHPMRVSSAQHAVSMRYWWQPALLADSEDDEGEPLGMEEGELRARLAAGVWTEPTVRQFEYRYAAGGWRVFNPAHSEGEEDGRTAFFRLLEYI